MKPEVDVAVMRPSFLGVLGAHLRTAVAGALLVAAPQLERVVPERFWVPMAQAVADGLHWLGIAVLCWLPVLAFAQARTGHYRVTSERLSARYGAFAPRHDEIELYRVRTIGVQAGLLQHLFGTGDLLVSSAIDRAAPIRLRGVRAPARLKEQLRSACRDARREEGVQVIELLRPAQ